jgi:Protein of unknown function (DUF2569)
VTIVFSLSRWGALASPSSPSYHPAVAVLLMVELAVQLAIAAYAFVLVLLFLGRRRSFPPLFRIYALAGIAYPVADVALSTAVSTHVDPSAHMRGILQHAVYAVVWIFYLSSSRRAASTFVEPAEPGPYGSRTSTTAATSSVP